LARRLPSLLVRQQSVPGPSYHNRTGMAFLVLASLRINPYTADTDLDVESPVQFIIINSTIYILYKFTVMFLKSMPPLWLLI